MKNSLSEKNIIQQLKNKIAELEQFKTESKKVEKKKQIFNKIIDTTLQSVIITTVSGKVLYVNSSYYTFSGFAKDEVIGKSMFRFANKKGAIKLAKVVVPALFTERHWRGEITVVRKNKQIVPVDLICSLISDEKNKPEYFAAIFSDITERKHAEEEKEKFITDLMEREEKFRTLTQNLNVGVYRSTPGKNGKFVEVNQAFLKMFEFRSKSEIERWKIVDLYPDPTARDSFEKTLKNKGFLINEQIQLSKKDGTRFIASITVTAAKDEKGNIIHYDGIIEDCTEEYKTREDILTYQSNLKSLANDLISTEEQAKRQLAITLHDKLGQSLVLAKFKADELNKKTADSEDKRVIEDIISNIEEAITESRNITYELSPAVLYEMGLISAISLKLDDIEKTNKINTSLIDQSNSYELEEKIQIILYRAISELLQNVTKHSKADIVNISFRLLTNNYKIIVSDNGIGFNLKAMREESVSQKKFGLFSIMERIRYIGGKVDIDTAPKKGTRVVIDLPIKN